MSRRLPLGLGKWAWMGAGEAFDVWLCPVCRDVWTAKGEDAHCAGSLTEDTAHESAACERVTLVREPLLDPPAVECALTALQGWGVLEPGEMPDDPDGAATRACVKEALAAALARSRSS